MALRISTIDYHTAGEPFRVVVQGGPDIPGDSVGQRLEMARGNDAVQAARRLLCHEPRGHADMYGCFLVPPDDAGAHLGVLFWHKDGFSTACGHGSIALGVWAVEQGIVAARPDGMTDVVIDVPSGRVTAAVSCEAGSPRRVTFRNVPAHVVARDLRVDVAGRPVPVDVAYGGAIYATARARDLGLTVEPGNLDRLIESGRTIKHALRDHDAARHPADERLSGIYGVILYDDLGAGERGPRQRNVTIFADGEVDRSPCGSGTSARVALLAEEGRLGPGDLLEHESIIGTRFQARVAARLRSGGRDAVVTEVEGMAYRTGEHTFILGRDDPLGTGFVLR